MVKPLQAGDSSSLVTSSALGREPARDRGRRDRSRSRGRREAPPPHGYLPPGPLAQSLRRSLQELWFSSIRLGILVSKWQSCVPPSRAFRSFQSAKMRVWKNAYSIKKVDYSNYSRAGPTEGTILMLDAFLGTISSHDSRPMRYGPPPGYAPPPGYPYGRGLSGTPLPQTLTSLGDCKYSNRLSSATGIWTTSTSARHAVLVWKFEGKEGQHTHAWEKKVQKQGDHAHFSSEVAA